MILITGDSGFIGSYLTPFLINRGYLLRGIDLVPRNNSTLEYEQIVGDILDKEAVMRAMRGCDCIIHLAAEHKDFGISREKYFQINVDGTKKLLECASKFDVKKFIFFSSVAVYGSSPFPSEDTLPTPVNPYGESKLTAENLVQQWAREDHTRQAIILRPTVVFGPRNHANIFKLIQYVCDGRFIWIGKGENVKSLSYVENVVEATFFLMMKMEPGVEVLNYVDEPQMTTRELVSLIAAKAGLQVPKLSIPLEVALPAAKLFDVIGSFIQRDFSITSARIKKFNTTTCYQAEKIRSLGFKTPYSIEQGIEKNVRWYKEELNLKAAPSYISSAE